MLDSNEFINELVKEKYTHLCVVPCSFAKNIINSAINKSKKIEYVPCASEAVACSIAAGLKMSGMKPIVIIQSSGLTNMGSCITSLLGPYEINFPIITSWRTYKEGDSEIQHMHLAKKLPDLILAYGYDYEILDQDSISSAINLVNQSNECKKICILMSNTFSKVELEEENKLDLSPYLPRSLYLKALNELYKNKNTLFIGTTGNTAREMYSFMPDTNNFYMAGNMGGALSIGLGAAKAGKKVIICGGDAEFVMHMGGLTSAGRYSVDIDLTYILFDNESNKSTGGQYTGQSHVNYSGIATNSNFINITEIVTNIHKFNESITLTNNNGAKFIHVKCSYDEETPRPPLNLVKVNSFK
ncbi:thiamine pyrophosphate-dependent enzyme [Gammaproteobacteria bacterium]|nr:thiamine pyrophosphate-dependent enzyme [Gammaproteobacteria bacterium]